MFLVPVFSGMCGRWVSMVRAGVFQHVARGPGRQHLPNGALVVGHKKHQDAHTRALGLQPPGGGQAVEARHVQVGQHHVAGGGRQLPAAFGFAHHVQQRLLRKPRAQAIAQDGVVADEEQARHGVGESGRGMRMRT